MGVTKYILKHPVTTVMALLCLVVFGISSVGGVVEVMNHATSMPGYFSLTHTFDVLNQQTGDYGPLTIFSTLAWGLGYWYYRTIE